MNRILYYDGSSLTDYSTQLANYYSDSVAVTMLPTHKIYIGCVGPFNHQYFKVSTPSIETFNFSVKYFSGTEFLSAVDVIDETNMAKESGHLTFTPNKYEGSWQKQETTEIPELASVTIYDRYWIEISVDAATGPISLQWLGQIFSNDVELGSEYPDLVRTDVKDAFETGKSDWEEQSMRAGEVIVKDLIAKGIINDKCQILDREKLRLASVSKVASIIFNALGDDYVDNRTDATADYNRRLDLRLFNVDLDGDGILDSEEQVVSQGWLTR